jgi:FAD/FMN-containing dehydrogenase
MGDMRIRSRKGGEVGLNEADVSAFRSSLKGRLLFAGDDGYDTARTIWNAMIDRRPAVIVQPENVEDIVSAVNFARENGLLLCVKGGGHNIAGNAVCDGGLMIDLSGMNSVTVDKERRIAQVGPGAKLADFDREAQAKGLATPLGINSTTGVAGLTLGGGFGWLSRKYGTTVDNLLSADVVTADGKTVRASESENSDLFWGLRGGGGNFGIVTNFEYKLHPVGPDVLTGLIVFPFDQAKDVLRKYRDAVKGMSDDLNVWVVLRKAPPLPFLPEDSHFKEVVIFACFYAGDPSEGEKLLEPFRSFGTPVGEFIGVQPYAAWQQAFDPLLTPGLRNYWKSHNFAELPDEAIDIALKYVSDLPSPHTEIFFGLVGGQASRVPSDATAYSQRDALWACNVHGRWESPQDDQKVISWAREFFDASAPYSTGGVYVNFMTEDEKSRVTSAYKPEIWNRLVELKRKYDPTNLFSMNQNINPDGA